MDVAAVNVKVTVPDAASFEKTILSVVLKRRIHNMISIILNLFFIIYFFKIYRRRMKAAAGCFIL
jgi:hypothetical protein